MIATHTDEKIATSPASDLKFDPGSPEPASPEPTSGGADGAGATQVQVAASSIYTPEHVGVGAGSGVGFSDSMRGLLNSESRTDSVCGKKSDQSVALPVLATCATARRHANSMVLARLSSSNSPASTAPQLLQYARNP